MVLHNLFVSPPRAQYLHISGLVHALAAKESSVASLLPMVLRALCVVMSASPYDRLPRQLLPDTTAALLERWSALSASIPAPTLTRWGSSSTLAPTLTRWAGPSSTPAPTLTRWAGSSASSTPTLAQNASSTLTPTQPEGGSGKEKEADKSCKKKEAEGSRGTVGGRVGALQIGEALALQVMMIFSCDFVV